MKYMNIAPNKYNIGKYSCVYYEYDSYGYTYFELYFDSIISHISYIIYKLKNTKPKNKDTEAYLNYVMLDIKEFKKKNDRLMDEAKKSLDKYINKEM